MYGKVSTVSAGFHQRGKKKAPWIKNEIGHDYKHKEKSARQEPLILKTVFFKRGEKKAYHGLR